MSGFYTYLISSLPFLSFGAKPPISFERFLSSCTGFVSEAELQILKQLDLSSVSEPADNETIKQWFNFEISLRNELVRMRAAKRHIDPVKYLRGQSDPDPLMAHNLLVITRNPHPLELEKALDKFRWDFLDGLSFGHFFDFHLLLVYAYKLLILEKWQLINSAESEKLLTEVMQ